MVELIIGIIGAIAAVVAAVYAIRNDKAHIKSRIRKKEQKIRDLQKEEVRQHGFNIPRGAITPQQEKIERIRKEIANLEDRL